MRSPCTGTGTTWQCFAPICWLTRTCRRSKPFLCRAAWRTRLHRLQNGAQAGTGPYFAKNTALNGSSDSGDLYGAASKEYQEQFAELGTNPENFFDRPPELRQHWKISCLQFPSVSVLKIVQYTYPFVVEEVDTILCGVFSETEIDIACASSVDRWRHPQKKTSSTVIEKPIRWKSRSKVQTCVRLTIPAWRRNEQVWLQKLFSRKSLRQMAGLVMIKKRGNTHRRSNNNRKILSGCHT